MCIRDRRYAMRISKNPELSPMYELDKESELKAVELDSFGPMNAGKCMIIAALVAALGAMVYGLSLIHIYASRLS